MRGCRRSEREREREEEEENMMFSHLAVIESGKKRERDQPSFAF
jgi:hypothetical protein